MTALIFRSAEALPLPSVLKFVWRVVRYSGEVDLSGVAHCAALVKGAGFSPARNAPRATKRRIAISRREIRIEDRKTSNASLSFQKSVHINSGFAEDGAKRSFRHVAGMMRDRDFSSGFGLAPDLVAACARAIESKSERAKTLGNLAVAKSG